MIVTLNKQYIYEYVYLLTGSFAANKGEKYACTPDNATALDRLFDTAVNNIETRLIHSAISTYNTTLQLNSNDVSLYLDDKNGHLKESTKGAIATNLRLAIAYQLTAMWLISIDTELSSTISTSSESYVTDIILLVNQVESWLTDDDYQAQSSDQVVIDKSASNNDPFNNNTDHEITGPSSDSYFASEAVKDNMVEKPVVPINAWQDDDGEYILSQIKK